MAIVRPVGNLMEIELHKLAFISFSYSNSQIQTHILKLTKSHSLTNTHAVHLGGQVPPKLMYMA